MLAFWPFFKIMSDRHSDGEYVILLYQTRVTFTEPLLAGVVLHDINSTAEFL